jgi:hypothetical protein
VKPSWHQIAARVAAQNPSWSWEKVCAFVGARGGKKKQAVAQMPVEQFTKKMEQLKLW